MIWNSVGDFLSMGGYGLYVWGSFGACVLVLVAEPLLVGKRHGDALRSLRRQVIADRLEKESE